MSAKQVPCEERYHALVYKEAKEYEMFCRGLDKDRKQTLNELTQNERLFRKKYSFLLSRRQQMEIEDGTSRSEHLNRMISFEVSKSSGLKQRIETFFERMHFPLISERVSRDKKEELEDSTSQVYDLKKESMRKDLRKYGNKKLGIRRSSFPVVRSRMPARRQSLFKT